MAEYAKTYEVRRQMHNGPYVGVGRVVADRKKAHRSSGTLDVYVRNVESIEGASTDFFDAGSVIALLTKGVGVFPGAKVEIKAVGELEVTVLQEVVEAAGAVFSTKDDSYKEFE